jgi:hypothetical protein
MNCDDPYEAQCVVGVPQRWKYSSQRHFQSFRFDPSKCGNSTRGAEADASGEYPAQAEAE